MALPGLIRTNRNLFSDFFRDLDDFFDMSSRSWGLPIFSRELDDIARMPDLVTRTAGELIPSMDVREDDDRYYLSVDLPGVKKEDVKVDIRDDVVSICGERRHEERKQGTEEREYGCFRRSFTLPRGTNADQIEANYENGMLELAVPKSEASKRRSIEIREGRGVHPQIPSGKQADPEKKKTEQSGARH